MAMHAAADVDRERAASVGSIGAAAGTALLSDSAPQTSLPEIVAAGAELERALSAAAERQQPNQLHCCGTPAFGILCVLVTTLSSCLLGYDIGIWAVVKIKVQDRFSLSDIQIGVLVGMLNLIAGVGGLASGKLSDVIGRRRSIAVACVLFIVGSFFKCLANGYAMLMVGRIITGFGVGTGMAIAPLYSAELSPRKIRGVLVAFTEIAINVGILLGYGVGWALAPLSLNVGWRWMLAVGAFPPAIILVALVWMPESPRVLFAKGSLDQAATVLLRSSGVDEAREALETLQEVTQHETGSWRDFLHPTPTTKALLLAGLGTSFFQQITGVEAQVYYTPEILRDAGMQSEDQVLQGQLIVGAVKVLVIVAAAALVDREGKWYGRRTLLILSGIGMAMSQMLLGINFLVESTVALALFSQCFFMASFSIGFGPVTWILVGEIFPLRIRGQAAGLATFINRMTSGLIALTFVSLTKVFTEAGVFMMFAAISLFAVLFVWLKVPETKGKSLEEIEQEVVAAMGQRTCCPHCCLPGSQSTTLLGEVGTDLLADTSGLTAEATAAPAALQLDDFSSA